MAINIDGAAPKTKEKWSRKATSFAFNTGKGRAESLQIAGKQFISFPRRNLHRRRRSADFKSSCRHRNSPTACGGTNSISQRPKEDISQFTKRIIPHSAEPNISLDMVAFLYYDHIIDKHTSNTK